MNNLHRELAPISDGAWAQIEEEAQRTLKRSLAGRRVVDVKGPGGTMVSAVGTGHLSNLEAPGAGIIARQRIVKPLVELRVPFQLARQQIDDVERGANDSDWQPLKDAAKRIAFTEDRAIFEGYAAAGIEGVRQGTSNKLAALPGDHGYPVIQHIQRLVNDEIIFAPAITGAFVLTTRGGDFELHLGQDASIGYLSHDDKNVTLYLQETMTFLLLTTEASVALKPASRK